MCRDWIADTPSYFGICSYKDSRSGRRLKYAHSLRYLCAQRQDQDLTKRRSAAASAEKKKAAAQAQLVENGGQPDEATMAEQLQNASFLETAATDFNAATIAAIVQASQAATREAELENGGDGDGDGDADADGEGDDGNGGSRGGGGLSLLDGLGESGISVSGGDDEAMRSGQDNHEFDEHAQHHFQDALEYLPELEEQQDDENGKDKKGKKGKGKGKDKLNGGGAAKRMERFDCKGTLIINMYQDDETVQFALNHPMLHAEYRDVVGNSRRGFRYVPPPIEVPLVLEPAVDSPDMHGDDPWAQVENTFQSMLDLLKQLRENKGGGEEEAVQALYDSTLEVRKVRVSILEGLDRCAKGRKKAKAKKRRLDSESGIDEGALRLPPGPSGDILNNLLPDLPVSPMDGDGDGDDDLQSSMAPEVQNMVAMYVAQHTQVTSDGSWALDPSLDPSLQL